MNSITVTSQNANNYGAVLQSYALQQQLQNLNVVDEIIDLKQQDSAFFTPLRKNKYFLSILINNIISFLFVIPQIQKLQKFKKFIKNNIRTTKRYNSIQEIKTDPPVADVYITGSDQMFNTNSGVKDFNFLRFGDIDTKRISYATSMGQLDVNKKYVNEFISAINQYDFLSVREQSLKEYIQNLCEKECADNIDPTFLLEKEDWFTFTGKSKFKEKYILVYVLIYNPLINSVIEKLKHETGYKIVIISSNARNLIKGDKVIRNAGIEEFLNLFRYAEIILTTSFHGTCFSIIFQKLFYCFIREGVETRITNVLNKLNLENQIVTELSQISLDEINYEFVNEIIKFEKQKSINYLRSALF